LAVSVCVVAWQAFPSWRFFSSSSSVACGASLCSSCGRYVALHRFLFLVCFIELQQEVLLCVPCVCIVKKSHDVINSFVNAYTRPQCYIVPGYFLGRGATAAAVLNSVQVCVYVRVCSGGIVLLTPFYVPFVQTDYCAGQCLEHGGQPVERLRDTPDRYGAHSLCPSFCWDSFNVCTPPLPTHRHTRTP
jgi:hypothetical protein